jgi:hypothetical protein
VCTDGAAAMVVRQNGLTARLKTINSSIKWTHREALASKQLNEDLNSVLEIAVKTVNLVKSRPLNSRLFDRYVVIWDMNILLYYFFPIFDGCHVEKLFDRLFELRAKVAVILTQIKSEFVKYFQDELWIFRSACLRDIFYKINNLNLQLQGFDTNSLILHDKVQALREKLAF